MLLSREGCLRAFPSVSHDDARVLVIHQGKFWPVRGTRECYGGGRELSNHTLHSLARNLITYKDNAARLSTGILILNFQRQPLDK